jgi:hypothetical protein
MEKFEIIISIAATLLGTLIPSAIALWTQIKAKRNAKTEAEAEKAKNAINAEIKRLVAGAEVSFEAIDKLLKNQNQTAGPMKKRDVISNLKTFCLENGYGWVDAEMDKAIEDEVAYTKVVNAKKTA